MVRTVERIEQEITALNRLVAAIAQEFHQAYSQYLSTLGQAVRQQLILASFHVCTHGYPDHFLRLSLNQRQELQQSLRRLSKQAQAQIQDLLQPIQPLSLTVEEFLSRPSNLASLELANLENEVATDGEEVEKAEEAPDEASTDLPTDSSPEAETPSHSAPLSESSESESSEPESSESESSESAQLSESISTQPESHVANSDAAPQEEDDRPITPIDVVSWQDDLEESIVEALQSLSYNANRILQQAEILPLRLPEPVLEVATKADLASETSNSPPNLLSLLVETASEEDKESAMTQITAIRLRLSEIEFSDQAATVWRSKIRNLSAQLNKLGREYQKKEREKAIAQAEAAWRSVWFDE